MRDALAQHEINEIVQALKSGDEGRLESLTKNVSRQWLEVNAEALHRLAGLEWPPKPREDLQSALDAPEPKPDDDPVPTGEVVQAAKEPEPPMAEEARPDVDEKMVEEPAKRAGKSHRK